MYSYRFQSHTHVSTMPSDALPFIRHRRYEIKHDLALRIFRDLGILIVSPVLAVMRKRSKAFLLHVQFLGLSTSVTHLTAEHHMERHGSRARSSSDRHETSLISHFLADCVYRLEVCSPCRLGKDQHLCLVGVKKPLRVDRPKFLSTIPYLDERCPVTLRNRRSPFCIQ